MPGYCGRSSLRWMAGRRDLARILLVDGDKKVALGTVKPEHCAPLAALATTFDQKTAAATSDREAAVTGRFKASGLIGDKLAWAIRWSKNDYDFYGVGGTILGPAQVKRIEDPTGVGFVTSSVTRWISGARPCGLRPQNVGKRCQAGQDSATRTRVGVDASCSRIDPAADRCTRGAGRGCAGGHSSRCRNERRP